MKRYDTANRIRSTCSQVFRYAIATARAERDICSDLRGALITPRTTHRAAITTAVEAGGLLRAIEDYEGSALTRVALRLLLHVFVRPGELRWAEWSEFDFDKRVWTIEATEHALNGVARLKQRMLFWRRHRAKSRERHKCVRAFERS